VTQPVEVALNNDALKADNAVRLEPVPPKIVTVALDNLGDVKTYFQKAIRAVPYTGLRDDPQSAALVFTARKDYAPAPANVRIYSLQGEASDKSSLAEGRDILPGQSSPITEGISFEGVLWPYTPLETPSLSSALLLHNGQPLFYLDSQSETLARYSINLIPDRTNLYRHTAWPLLINGIVEECRENMPGMSRSNFSAGEPISLRLRTEDKAQGRFQLKRNGMLYAEYDALPSVLQDLPAGHYVMEDAEGKQQAAFQVNLFSPQESDLRSLAAHRSDLDRLEPAEVSQIRRNMPLFYILLVLTLLFVVLAWVCQDISR